MSAYSDAVLADSPSYYYRLDETSGTTLDNLGSVGSAGDLTANATVDTEPGLITTDSANPSMKFSWNLSCFRASTSSSFSQEPLTIEFWVTPVSIQGFADGDAFVVTCGQAGAGGWALSWGDNTGVWKFTTLNVFDYTFSSATSAAIGVTQHVVVVLDTAHDATIYQNGAFVQTVTHTVAPNATSVGLQIGRVTGGTAGFEGVLDELAIYGTDIGSARVAAHYAAATTAAATPKPFVFQANRQGW